MTMAKKTARTTTKIAERDGYFAWNLDNGSVRILFAGSLGFDLPPSHAYHAKVLAATDATVEAVFDVVCGTYPTRSGR